MNVRKGWRLAGTGIHFDSMRFGAPSLGPERESRTTVLLRFGEAFFGLVIVGQPRTRVPLDSCAALEKLGVIYRNADNFSP